MGLFLPQLVQGSIDQGSRIHSLNSSLQTINRVQQAHEVEAVEGVEVVVGSDEEDDNDEIS